MQPAASGGTIATTAFLARRGLGGIGLAQELQVVAEAESSAAELDCRFLHARNRLTG